jgi:hypothetical protein
MNVFIDTCILYSDPFWTENLSSQMLELSRQGRIKIFLSEIVLKELRHNFEKSIDKEISVLRNSNSELKKIIPGYKSVNIPEKDQCKSEFDKFYRQIQTDNKVEILKCKDEFLQKVIEMSISRKKPFTDKKTELKDALIWITYSDYVNSNKLTDCYLLTQNCTDFCDPDKLKLEPKIYVLHPDLMRECDKFKMYISIKDFYRDNSSKLESPELIFQKWIKDQNIDDKYVFDLLINSNEDRRISEEVLECIGRLDPTTIFEDGYLVTMGGYLDVGEIEWYECKDTELLIVGDCAIVSGILVVSVEVEGYGYNSVRDSDEEKFPSIGDTTVEVDITFTFTLMKESEPEDFEVLGTQVK